MNTYTPKEWMADLESVLRAALCRVSNEIVPLEVGFAAVTKILKELKEKRGAVWWIGNGGSAAICSHLSQDLLNKIGIRSMTLSDPALITCMANDYDYENVYLQPLRTLVQDGDLLIAISSSGNSANILACADLAKEKNMKLITLSGFDARNSLWQKRADVSFYLPSNIYGQVEVGHEALMHAIIDSLHLGRNRKE